MGLIVFSCHRSIRLFKSRWPVERIWQENLRAEPQPIDLESVGGDHLMIYRRQFEVQVVNLNPHCYHLIEQLLLGQSIDQAWLNTLQQAQFVDEPLADDELSPILGYLLSLPLFTAFSLGSDHE